MKKNLIYLILGAFLVLILVAKPQEANTNKVIISMKTTVDGHVQLFYDIGKGLSETDSVVKQIFADDEYNLLSFSLPDGNYSYFRFDPINSNEGTVVISSMELYFSGGDSINLLNYLTPLKGVESITEVNERKEVVIVDSSSDPMMDFTGVKYPINLEGSKNINIQVHIFLLLMVGGILALIYRINWQISSLKYVCLLLFSLIIIILRNPDPIINPIIYTEDGVWISKLIYKGFFDTLWTARFDYLVLGNLVLSYLSLKINYILFGYNLNNLPYIIAAVSYLFYSVSYLFIYYIFEQDVKNKIFRCSFYFILLFIPLGNSANEIFGRISNIGYIIPILLMGILLIKSKKYKIVKTFFVVIFCLTNPICFVIYYLVMFINIINEVKNGKQIFFNYIKESLICLVLVSGSAFMIALRYLFYNQPVGLQDVLNPKYLIEGICARSILFPYIYNIYQMFNNLYSIVCIILFLAIVLYAFILSKPDERIKIGVVFYTFMIYVVFAFIMRPGLTSWIKDYSNTFPDRYFYAQNILSIFILVWSLEKIYKTKMVIIRYGVISLLIVILVTYTVTLNNIIEFGNSKMPLKAGLNFEEQIRYTYNTSVRSEDYDIPIYFEGWVMTLPEKYVKYSALSD